MGYFCQAEEVSLEICLFFFYYFFWHHSWVYICFGSLLKWEIILIKIWMLKQSFIPGINSMSSYYINLFLHFWIRLDEDLFRGFAFLSMNENCLWFPCNFFLRFWHQSSACLTHRLSVEFRNRDLSIPYFKKCLGLIWISYLLLQELMCCNCIQCDVMLNARISLWGLIWKLFYILHVSI